MKRDKQRCRTSIKFPPQTGNQREKRKQRRKKIRHTMLFFKSHRDVIGVWIKSLFTILLFVSFVFLGYTAFFSDQFWWSSISSTTTTAAKARLSAEPTDLSHIFFGVGGSANTWDSRRGYNELWWRPGSTRGFVWLDNDPQNTISKRLFKNVPPYRVSEDASRFGPRVSAARLARILSETYELLVVNNIKDVRWIVMGDDDTVFFPENLVAVLGKYDHREMYYIGSISESVGQATAHSFGMAFGGAGIAVSLPAAKEISKVFDGCLMRYNTFYGSDSRIHACLTDLGVPLTREPGFHQMDIRGDPFGMLAAHPIAPLVSLHHLDSVNVMFPKCKTQVEAVKKLIEVSDADPSRTLQQTICYESSQYWSVSVSWGYTVQIYSVMLTPKELVTSLQTFQTWRNYANGPFNFNTRPLSSDPCQQPLVFFLDGTVEKIGNSKSKMGMTSTIYKKNLPVFEEVNACNITSHIEASKVETIRVVAPIMDPKDWKRAPRRQCCQARTKGTKMEVKIRKCVSGETSYTP